MNCSIIRILKIKTPIVYGPIQVISQEQNDVTNLCQYSWSSDDVCWTQWVDYNTYIKTAVNIEGDFYLRVKLFGSFDRISINGLFTKCYSICLDNTNPFLANFCEGSILFDPYANLDCALLMQQQLADGIICMLGLPIYYFRVTPKEDTKDYNFKEYVFHNVESVKYIKMMIEDGQLPSSKPVFTEFDFDWENDWEVELSKTQFASAFGDNAFPKQRDLIYVPMMKRMYEVNSAYDEKNEGLMWRSTTWKLALVKYNDKNNVDKGSFEDVIDTLTVNDYDDIMGKAENLEAERQTGITQTAEPKFAANNLTKVYIQDAIRKEVTEDCITIERKLLNHLTTVSTRNMYYKSRVVKDLNSVPLITYQKDFCFESFSFSIIIDINKRIKNTKTTFAQIGNFIIGLNDYNLTVDDNDIDIKLEFGKTYIIWGVADRQTMNCVINVAEHISKNPTTGMPLTPNERCYFDVKNAQSAFVKWNDDWDCSTHKEPIILSPDCVGLANFKVFNTPLDENTLIKEIVKYTTNNNCCVINDLARPLNDGLGYDVR